MIYSQCGGKEMVRNGKICPFANNCTANNPEGIDCKSNYAECQHYSYLTFVHSLPIPLVCPFYQKDTNCMDSCDIPYIHILEDYRNCPTFSKKFYKLLTCPPEAPLWATKQPQNGTEIQKQARKHPQTPPQKTLYIWCVRI